MTNKVEPTQPRIQTLARADAILSCVQNALGGLITLAEICEALSLNKTTVFNLSESLVVLGFLTKTAKPKIGYKLGLRNIELGQSFTKNWPLVELGRSAIKNLCQATGETVNLAFPYLNDCLIVDAMQSEHAVRSVAYAGLRTFYHSSACGKAILAFLSEGDRNRLYQVSGLPKLTENTMVVVQILEEDLKLVRKNGFAIDSGENELGGYCVGVPIMSPFEDKPIASLSVSGPIHRMTGKKIPTIIKVLKSESLMITQSLKDG